MPLGYTHKLEPWEVLHTGKNKIGKKKGFSLYSLCAPEKDEMCVFVFVVLGRRGDSSL